MADSLFETIAGALESSTSLTRLEARGTLRLACKEAGVDTKNASAHHFEVVLQKLMPRELEARGIADAAAVCERLAAMARESGEGNETGGDSPEDIFGRLGG